MTLDTDISYIKGVGPQQAQLFGKINIKTIFDLILHKPRRWEDFSKVCKIADLKLGKTTILAQILEVKGRYLGYRGLHLTEALVQDSSGAARVIWFNQPYRKTSLKLKAWYYFSGNYSLQYKRLQFVNPSTELIEGLKSQKQLVKSVYSTTAGLKNIQIQRALRQIQPLFDEIKEPLPDWLIKKANLPPLSQTYGQLHFPQTYNQTQQALKDLSLRELITISLSSQLLKSKIKRQKGHALILKSSLFKDFTQHLNFSLTDQQKQISQLVLKQLQSGQQPLNHLIQGDVGAGKTVIATLITLNVILNNYQVAFMAPTQILAKQHLNTLQDFLKPFLKKSQIVLLEANLKTNEKRALLNKIKNGEAKLIVGTHALLSKEVDFLSLGLIVIDEQHRFGVEQRLQLLKKAQPELSNILTLSATPIPRSLALVLYADLDISLLTQKPPNRQIIETQIIALNQRATKLKTLLQKKEPTYIICPAIEDNEIEDSLQKTQIYLKKLIPNLDYAILHGKLDQKEQEEIILNFQKGKFSTLISTTVIGAGIDITCVNQMIIMSPERFGLAQLHQLRGRVGRNTDKAYCYLCPYSNQAPSERLQALLKYQDGFKLSELDLKLRGPGTLYGMQQTGLSLIFEIGLNNPSLIKLATSLAKEFIKRNEDLKQFPILNKSINHYQKVTHLN